MQSRLTMSDSTHLMTWVTRQTKATFGIVARRQGLSESALLKRMIEVSLMTAGAVEPMAPKPTEPIPLNGRLSMRLPADDLASLRARATARDMATSTYTAYLIRAHLRALTPLPTDELAALKRSVAELGAIGRNINQIARGLNQGERPSGPS